MKKNSMAAFGAGVLTGYATARLLTASKPSLPVHTGGARVVILGAGFGGLAAASKLSKSGNDLRITLVDRHNYHLFTPMLYQAATCGIVPYDAAIPVRNWSGRNHIIFRNGTVRAIDLDKSIVHVEDVELAYDYLIVALGSTTNFFGNQSAQSNALALKTLEDGLVVRNHIIDTLERAAAINDVQERRELLTYVVVGGGATGVETAGALAGLLRQVLATDYPTLSGQHWNVIILDAAPKLLGHMSQEMSSAALSELKNAGVDVRLNTKAKEVTSEYVATDSGERIRARTVVWATGVRAAELAASLSTEHGRGGSIAVDECLHIKGREYAYAIGDNAQFVNSKTNEPVPLLAATAMQQGEAAAKNIIRRLRGRPEKSFQYHNLGNVVSVGTRTGVAQFGGKVIVGFAGWLAWRVVHLARITNMRNQLATALDWTTAYFYDVDTARLLVQPNVKAA
ncbi:MAG TPA: NAD(P)/FAD-dependent oxidoreductase [Candidatus Angelobacter sp.]|nr:NAD(P)/FAD-dependent oxidoreductase [Candidatus Angelobacter sp.]